MLTFVECGDDIYPAENIAGFNPIMSVVPLDGENVTKGMVAYLTLLRERFNTKLFSSLLTSP
jgi:hypothetical protein